MKRKGIWRIVLPAAVFLAVMFNLTSCQNAGHKAEQENAGQENVGQNTAGQNTALENAVQTPGEFENGVFVSRDGHFMVRAGEDEWEVSELDGEWELRMKEDPSVSISFSQSEGITPDLISGFEKEFADRYVEAMKEEYPDVRKKEIHRVNDFLAGVDIVMTDPVSQYEIYQILYLAADNTGGYMILSSLSEKESDLLAGKVKAVIESLEFISN